MHLSRPLRLVGLALVLSIGISTAVRASEELLLQLPSGQEFEIQRFPGKGKSRLLWLPSERGFGPGHVQQADALARLGYEVWLADLHGGYFVETGRRSIEQFPLPDIVAIIEAAIASSATDVFIVSSSRGAQLGLIAAREWQLTNAGRSGIAGLVLAHAYLYQARPKAGDSAVFLPIVGATNLPVYLLDAQYSTGSARIGELAKALGAGGSQVYTQVIRGVQGGFFVRDRRELDPADLAARERFPRIVERGLKALALAPVPKNAVATRIDTRRLSSHDQRVTELQPLATARATPALQLRDFHGGNYVLDRQRGKVQLINFWASWCEPCVREIPSLHRLQRRIGDPDFSIVTVNVGEEPARIERFLSRVAIELPLLLDLDSEAAREWRIYVYPSTYLVDRQGRIRYAYLGALEWDSPENIAIIQNLLRQR